MIVTNNTIVLCLTLMKKMRLLEKAKAEKKRCKGLFATANEEVLKELGI